MTDLHEALDTWLREGRPDASYPCVREHLAECQSCRRALAEIDETRGWYGDPGEVVSAESVNAIRFQLQTVARLAGGHARTTESQKRSLTSARSFYAAAVWLLVVCTGFGAAYLFVYRGSDAEMLVRVEASRGTKVHRIEGPPHEGYRIDEGSAWFTVTRLKKGQSVRVVVGRDLVSVRGTRFLVRATSGHLDAVNVSEGVVWVHLAVGRDLRLRAGEAWYREKANKGSNHEITALPSSAPIRGKNTIQPSRATTPPVGHPSVEMEMVSPAHESDTDVAFGEAWRLYREGRADAAAYAFDALLRKDLGDRRPDALFWSARAHLQAGRVDQAKGKLDQLLRAHPNSWHASEARELLRRLPK